MAKTMIKRLSVILLTLMISLSGCSIGQKNNGKSTTAVSTETKGKVQKQFDKYLSETFKESVTEDSVTLHYTVSDMEKYGITPKKLNIGVIDFNELNSTETEVKKEFAKLKKFDYQLLTKKQQQTYDVINDYLTTQKKLAPYPYLQTILSSRIGVQAQLPVTLSEYRLSSKQDVDEYLTLLGQVKSYFDSVITYEKEQIKRGYFMSDESVDAVLKQIQKFTSAKQNNALIEVFNTNIQNVTFLNAVQKKQYQAKNRELVLKQVIPAYESLYSSLNALKGNGKNDKGLCYFKNGKKYYEALVEIKSSSHRSVNSLITLTENDLKKMQTTVASIAMRNGAAYREFGNFNIKEHVSSDPKNILELLKGKLTQNYPAPANVGYTVKYVHPSQEADLSPAFYMIPPIDSFNNNVIYVNRSQMNGNDGLFSTLAHEGYPGHMYQTTYFDNQNPYPVRAVMDYLGYDEGWATYVECNSYSYLNLNTDVVKLLQINTAYNLALCSRVDFGVNYQGWDLEKATEYLKSYNIVNTSTIQQIYRSVIQEPAAYLSYYVGYKEFGALKSYYKKKSGSRYSEKKFHQIVLDAGPCSFTILEKRVQEALQ